MDIQVPISVGELLDKISILRIKHERMTDAKKLANVARELDALSPLLSRIEVEPGVMDGWFADLARVNGALWVIEDDIRECEARGDFGPRFVELARSVYVTNDERAAIKKRVNLATGSALVEEKSYKG